MNLTQAQKIAGTLGHPSKMPGLSYGIPADACKTGGKLKLIPHSVCNDCYAEKGNYKRYPSIKIGQEKRLAGLAHPQWVEAMIYMIRWELAKGVDPHVRFHDSGDLQSLRHLIDIAEIARSIPEAKFWLPTREYNIIKRFFDAGYTCPKNLIIRVSAPLLDSTPPSHYAHGSSVHTKQPPTGAHPCPSEHQNGKCGDCRACWSPDVKLVSYHKH